MIRNQNNMYLMATFTISVTPSPLAIIRLLLLFIPLPYHSYTGKAIRCPVFYKLLYGTTLVVVLWQMLALMILDPDSLSTIVVTVVRSSLHRSMSQVWLILTLTILSNSMQMILFWHVRSTGQTDGNWLATGRQRHVLYFFTSTQGSNGGLIDDEGVINGRAVTVNPEHSQNSPRTNSKFMVELQTRFHQTKQQWTQRLEDFTSRVVASSSTRRRANSLGSVLHLPQTPFSVLLQLFAYDDEVLTELNVIFERDPKGLTFYVPQLLTFLLHGAYHNAHDLEEWILSKCRLNIHFCHKCYWFLRAWCLDGSHAEQQHSMSRNASFSSLLGVEQGQTPIQPHAKYPPESRSAVKALLQRVVECGRSSAQALHQAATSAKITSGPLVAENEFGFVSLNASASAVMMAVESGSVPIDPATKCPSVRHIDSISATEKMGLLPYAATSIPPDMSESLDRDHFQETPNFLDALLNIADSLFDVTREDRTKELRHTLQRLEVECLPANSIYMPVANTYHWTWRIVVEECIAISTKERVPCIIAMEVIDYIPYSSRRETAGMFGEIKRQASNDECTSNTILPTNVALAQSPMNQTLSSSNDEKDMVNSWRTSQRNPRRLETLLDKVTSFTQDAARTAKESLRKIQQLSQHENGELSLLRNFGASSRESSFSGDGKDHCSTESTYNNECPKVAVQQQLMTPPASPQTTPQKVWDPMAERDMGQWSSPASPRKMMYQTSPSRDGESGPQAFKGGIPSNDDFDNGGYDDGVMDALLDIRHNMDDFKFGEPKTTRTLQLENPETSSAYGSTQKQKIRPPPVVFKESWTSKEARIRKTSAYGSHANWRLCPILVKSNDDLRQEQLASQLIYRMAAILAREKIPVWLCPYDIVALTDRGGIIEAIPDTISLDSLKRNDPNFESLKTFFERHFEEGDDIADAKANFVESLAAYSVVCYLLQIKDRHNGNILLDRRGHLIHIDFGFFFLSSPGKNSGFESAPFKLTADFVDLMGGPHSHHFRMFSELCCRTFLTLRKRCLEITLLVEMLMVGNEDLNCFRGRPEDAVRGLRKRFRLDLNDTACMLYVQGLVDESLENWRTRW
eukprot:CAMPEP_0194263842 /NCGR_PEP_ID=MMETSP0158-20130606/47271_1 /TAXON_ID=33649 /ORGANISM="Thalassionema nitzschioides, Strain L26-B" /LENGTH=1084 /DNA_ID=CAMNT_0039004059 /DNA_START=40 /DNA_END=3290 /DNA_ORIENTATION=-